MYRRATEQEIREAYSQLDHYTTWKEVFDFISNYYNILAVSYVTFKTGRYEDYPYKEYLEWIFAYDENGQILSFDYSLPLFQEKKRDGRTYGQICKEAFQKSMDDWKGQEEVGKKEAVLASFYALDTDHPNFYEFSNGDTYYKDEKREFGKSSKYQALYVEEEGERSCQEV